MIDKIFGRDSIEEQVEEPVEKPAEMQVPKSQESGLTLNIRGLWTGAARDYDPKSEITIAENTEKVFYRIESSGSGFGKQRHITKVFVNGKMILKENGTIKEGDPTDTGVIAFPSRFRSPGAKNVVVINIESWEKEVLYVSPEFLVNVQ